MRDSPAAQGKLFPIQRKRASRVEGFARGIRVRPHSAIGRVFALVLRGVAQYLAASDFVALASTGRRFHRSYGVLWGCWKFLL